MPYESSPEAEVLTAIVEQLKQVTSVVLLGYAAQGLDGDDAPVPAILVQLESWREMQQQGGRSKIELQLGLSIVEQTDEQSVYRLLSTARAIRAQFMGATRWHESARRTELGEVDFDIAPSRGQLSFADIALRVEMVI